MQGSIINNGIVITAEDRASAIFGAIGQSFQKMRQEFAVGAKEIPKKTEEAFRPFQNLENVLRTNIKDGFQSATDQLNEDFRAFNRDVRHHINNFNSMIMGGVAVAMSGLGIQRTGQAIT